MTNRNLRPLILLLFFIPFLRHDLAAQQVVKRYVTIEHFTNTPCPICASKNPAFYELIAKFSNDVHHVAVHPPIPFISCIFYQANKVDNVFRTNYYGGIDGTPRIAINGKLMPVSTPLLSQANLESRLNQFSPVSLQVQDAVSGTTHSALVAVTTHSPLPAGNYKLYVVAAEKKIDYNAPNGEKVHYDVLRKLLPDTGGVVFKPTAAGVKTVFNFSYTLNANWNAKEMFVTAFLQNTVTKEILNSGTRFDPPPVVVTAVDETIAPIPVQVAPNPAQTEIRITLPDDHAVSFEVFAINGQRVKSLFGIRQETVEIPIVDLAPGLYYVKLRGEKAVYTGKFVRQ